MPEVKPAHRPRMSRYAAHLLVLLGIAAALLPAMTGIASQPRVELVSAAQAYEASATPAVDSGPELLTDVGPDGQLADRGRLSQRVAPPATPLPTPVPIDPAATPLPAPPTAAGSLAFPVPGGSISQFYRAGHEAVDIAAAPGVPVVAAEDGMVVSAGWRNNGGGLVVEIDHDNGLNTVYNHLGSISVVAGQYVGRGVTVGSMGCSGVCLGSHVQFDVRIKGRLIDPMVVL